MTLLMTVTHEGIEKPSCSTRCDVDRSSAHVSVFDQGRFSDDSMARRRASKSAAFVLFRARAMLGEAGMCGGSRGVGLLLSSEVEPPEACAGVRGLLLSSRSKRTSFATFVNGYVVYTAVWMVLFCRSRVS